MAMPDPTQLAVFHIGIHPFSLDAKVEVTPRGLLAIAALVGGILLATAVLVQAARK